MSALSVYVDPDGGDSLEELVSVEATFPAAGIWDSDVSALIPVSHRMRCGGPGLWTDESGRIGQDPSLESHKRAPGDLRCTASPGLPGSDRCAILLDISKIFPAASLSPRLSINHIRILLQPVPGLCSKSGPESLPHGHSGSLPYTMASEVKFHKKSDRLRLLVGLTSHVGLSWLPKEGFDLGALNRQCCIYLGVR
jgi:hypothetical protein